MQDDVSDGRGGNGGFGRGPAESVLLALAAAAALAILWSLCCTAPGIPWNAVRLAPSFALARGLPVYVLRDSGAQLGWFYGPVFPLWYLPFGWLENPTVALMAAAVWNALTLLVPVYACLRLALGGPPRLALGLTLIGAVLILANGVTQAALLFLHVDVLCVAFSLAAALWLHAGAVGGRRWGLPLGALALGLAVGTKQVAVALVPASFVWLWCEGHGRLAGRWLFHLAVWGGGLGTVFIAAFGAEQLWFNTYLVLSRTPWADGMSLGRRLVELLRSGWVWWLVAVLTWLLLRPRRCGSRVASASLVRLLLWLAVAQVPLGLAASLKAGGGLNSMHALFYVLVAGLVEAGEALRIQAANRRARRILWLALVLAAALGWGGRLLVKLDTAWTPYRGLEQLLAQSRATPGRFYMPWNPLITLMSEHKVYPSDDALLSLWRAGLEPPPEVIRAAVPPGAVLIYEEASQSHFALKYFGARDRPVDGAKP